MLTKRKKIHVFHFRTLLTRNVNDNHKFEIMFNIPNTLLNNIRGTAIGLIYTNFHENDYI